MLESFLLPPVLIFDAPKIRATGTGVGRTGEKEVSTD